MLPSCLLGPASPHHAPMAPATPTSLFFLALPSPFSAVTLFCHTSPASVEILFGTHFSQTSQVAFPFARPPLLKGREKRLSPSPWLAPVCCVQDLHACLGCMCLLVLAVNPSTSRDRVGGPGRWAQDAVVAEPEHGHSFLLPLALKPQMGFVKLPSEVAHEIQISTLIL